MGDIGRERRQVRFEPLLTRQPARRGTPEGPGRPEPVTADPGEAADAAPEPPAAATRRPGRA